MLMAVTVGDAWTSIYGVRENRRGNRHYPCRMHDVSRAEEGIVRFWRRESLITEVACTICMAREVECHLARRPSFTRCLNSWKLACMLE